jgi:hypothetical protein
VDTGETILEAKLIVFRGLLDGYTGLCFKTKYKTSLLVLYKLKQPSSQGNNSRQLRPLLLKQKTSRKINTKHNFHFNKYYFQLIQKNK